MGYESDAFYLRHAVKVTPEIIPEPGHSGYFASPDSDLDPSLFAGEHLKPEIRAHIIGEISRFWSGRYNSQSAWSRLWLAGSGISYQWSGDRGNGDLDVMVGITAAVFRQHNPGYGAYTDAELADHINGELKTALWPATASTTFASKTFELTFFWNPACSADLGGVRNINPYAAYDLTAGAWTIRPPQLPANPRSLYPREWWQQIDRQADVAREILARFNNAHARLAGALPGSPGETNASTELRLAAAQAAALFDDIHLGRKAAFGPGGSGYGDYANFRWQAFKANGVGPALAEAAAVARSAHKAAELGLYGQSIADHKTALREALSWTSARGVR
ncbi:MULTISPECIES: hypothetical protein [Streptosporangium]|uniref:Nucleotidyltransferase n=1 Tax=Streptosporangium brasiliense TaxID=47480 RepID=A0ABT9RM86_9ACTN|nr:hypothetical protein [Streptosporangium brasiliense]MDP9870402.1 hypothetical protein [Streptosporangium brasiliense]